MQYEIWSPPVSYLKFVFCCIPIEYSAGKELYNGIDEQIRYMYKGEMNPANIFGEIQI